jgi:uracil-DNA glycosylase family 4
MKDRTFKSIIGSDNPLETARVILAPYNHKRVNDLIDSCSLCNNNCKKRLTYGNSNANILIISDYATDIPEYDEYFKYLLDNSDIDQNDIYVTNAVNCICKRSDGQERIPTFKELSNCKRYTEFVIDFVKPRVIISMGATSLNQFTPDNVNILENIDKNTCYKGIHTIITYSIRDIFNFEKYDEPTDDKINDIIESFNKAQQYINNRR